MSAEVAAAVGVIRINVLKPFVFSWQPPGSRLHKEQAFTKGVHEVPADHPMFMSPWITEHFADGRIESPAQAQARLDKLQEDATKAAKDGAAANAAASAAFARTVASRGGPTVQVDQAKLERELNTPLNELREQQSADPSRKGDVFKPVNQLRSEQGLEPPAKAGGTPRPGI